MRDDTLFTTSRWLQTQHNHLREEDQNTHSHKGINLLFYLSKPATQVVDNTLSSTVINKINY